MTAATTPVPASAPLPAEGGAVASPHAGASEVGAEVLRAGGNAIDAAIATAAALCVAYPSMVHLGGDLVALVRTPDGVIRCVNATGTAPRGQTRERLAERHGDALPLRGIDTITVPGAVRGWEALAAFGGRLGWADRLAPAERMAREGVPLAPAIARGIERGRPLLEQDAGFREVFLSHPEPARVGRPLVQPALADTLARIAAGGADEFYSGDVARRWVAGLEALGSAIAPYDAAAFAPEVVDALSAPYGDRRIHTSPPNTQGFALLRALRAVADAAWPDPLGADAGALVDAFLASNDVRARLLGDPRFGAPDGEALVAATAPARDADTDRNADGDTVGVAVASADGTSVSLIQSLYYGFGSGVLEPSTGVIFQNRGASFSLDPASPNVVAPGKRPRHTLMPVLVTRGDAVEYVSSTMGGQGQPQIHAQVLLRAFGGAEPAEAVAAPRCIAGADGDDDGRTVSVEADLDPTARDAIAAAGHPLVEVPARSDGHGHAHLVRVDPDGFTAGTDPRADGAAIVV
ncbi:gamma-glutamyltransferase family protein [Agromyces sp. SYSU T00194]|uniref:gamma-glutamyltransferase family protein n=1 Tax=Agromyces chitinivorans TaxID=3158560 RepID=UPI003393A2CE